MKVDVLDKGYIELVDTLGDDLTPVNAARVSFGAKSDKFSEKDKKLSKFLIKHKHFSPFRHQHLLHPFYVVRNPYLVEMNSSFHHLIYKSNQHYR